MTERLEGGSLTDVTRDDGRVLRATGPWSPAVHALLRHLERVGFDGCPRFLGWTDDGREVLSWVEGVSPGARPWPDWVWQDDVLRATGRWLRGYHDAVRSFREPADARWRMCWAPQGDEEIICHFDVAPRNLILQADGEIAIIDWDVAAPGTARADLAKAANAFLDPRRVDGDARYVAARIDVLLNAYGDPERASFVADMVDAARHSAARIRRGAADGDEALRTLVGGGAADGLERIGDRLEAEADAIRDQLARKSA